MSRPNWAALRFEQLAKRRGRQLTVLIKTPVGRDAYGNKIYTESEYQTVGFVESDAKEAVSQVGGAQEDELVAFIPVGKLAEPGWGMIVDGERYTISSVEDTPTFNKLKVGRSTH